MNRISEANIEPAFISSKEAQARIGCGRDTLLDLCKGAPENGFPARRLVDSPSGKRYVNKAALEAWLLQGQAN